MMRILKNAFALAIGLCLLASCSENDHKGKDESANGASTDSLREELLVLNDSIDKAWEVMIADDDEKLAEISRLLKELEYTGQTNLPIKTALDSMVNRVRKMRYSRMGMADSDAIDRYDYAIDTLVRSTVALANSTPSIQKYPLVDELLMDIRDKDIRVINYRVKFDAWAMEYNHILDQNRPQLEADGLADSLLMRKPLFQLMQ